MSLTTVLETAHCIFEATKSESKKIHVAWRNESKDYMSQGCLQERKCLSQRFMEKSRCQVLGSSKAYNTEAVRALNYINKLNGTVVRRAAKVSGEQAGMGWDAFSRLEHLMEWVTEEGRTATKLVTGMGDAKEAKLEGQGFPTLPLGSGKPKKGARKG